MRNLVFIIIAASLCGCSCSSRSRTVHRSINELKTNKITKMVYDSIIESYYSINKNNFVPNSNIKYKGSYLCTEYSDYHKKNDYRILKFTDSSTVITSIRFYDPVNNNTLRSTEGVLWRYTSQSDEIVVEYLLNKDWNLYNIFKYAKVNGDTLIFYKTSNLQIPVKKKGHEKKETFIYNDSLTEKPILPHNASNY